MAIFLQLLDTSDKAEALHAAILTSPQRRFTVDPVQFQKIPGSPFAYWISDTIREAFTLESFEAGDRIVRQGGVTGNDSRYLRLRWEVDVNKGPRQNWAWVPFAKGGNLARWYSAFPVVVIWDSNRSTFAGFTGLKHRPSEKPSSVDEYFKAGLTWPLRASHFAPVPLPAGCVFSIRGYAILAPRESLDYILAITNSRLFDYLFKVALGRSGFPEFVVGVLQKLPFPNVCDEQKVELGRLAKKAWSISRELDCVVETSPAFVLPEMLYRRIAHFDRSKIHKELSAIQTKIDDIVFALYGVLGEREAVEQWLTRAPQAEGSEKNQADESEEDEDGIIFPERDSLISWAIGVAFGRFDIRLATGKRILPREPDPFEALPSFSPAMCDPIDQVSLEGGFENQESEMMVADLEECLSGDINDAVWSVISRVRESIDLEGVPELERNDIANWISAEFFKSHVRAYSKSRRKAPIYLQVGGPRYSIWLYIHRIGADTFFRVQAEVEKKLKREIKSLDTFRAEATANAGGVKGNLVDVQSVFVSQLQDMHDEIQRIAPLWAPDLNDGVIINAAPLWRLFPQNKPWQKECKATWDELCKGKYDWAHLAMHLWPERVVPKCAEDRSLAIAHGLEDVFWFEDEDGKWKPLDKPTRPITEIINERTSPAVKAALKSLIEAPDTTAPVKRSRKAKTS